MITQTAKHRFGQGTLLSVYRRLILSLLAYLLAHWAYLSTNSTNLPDWGQGALRAIKVILPQIPSLLIIITSRCTLANQLFFCPKSKNFQIFMTSN